MKKVLSMFLALVMLFGLMTACGKSEPAAEAPAAEAAPSIDYATLGQLYLFVDGADVTDGNTTYDSISGKFADAEIDGNTYIATTLTNLCAYDISSVVGVFAEASDGLSATTPAPRMSAL